MNNFNFGKHLLETLKVIDPDSLTLKKIKKGETLYHQGEEAKGIYIIKTGLVGLVTLSPNGNESLLRVFGQEYFFGHRSLISDEPYHATAQALSNTTYHFITKQDFLKNALKRPELLLDISKVLAKELRRSENRLKDMSSKKVNARIIESLLFLKSRYPDYTWTRREIGEFCGAKTETVSRLLSNLEALALVEKNGRQVNILNPNKLLKEARKYDE